MTYKTVFSIALVMALRMIGLFMIMPLLALYTMGLPGSTPLLLGITLGIYGLTQALFQMPCGIISDFSGRKPVIVIGLSCFIVGSLIAASAHTIFAMLVGRAIQGCGAVGSTLMALLSDLTDEKHRARSMAILGGVIGISFSFSLVLGPVLNAWLSVPGIFLLCAAMGVMAIFILLMAVPNLKKDNSAGSQKFSISAVSSKLKRLITQKKIVQCIMSSMLLHTTLMMTFIGVPISLKEYAHIAQNQQWHIYLPVLLLSFMLAFLWIMLSEKQKRFNVSEPVQNLAMPSPKDLIFEHRSAAYEVCEQRSTDNQGFLARIVEILNRLSIMLSIGLIILSQITLALFHYDRLSISIGLGLFFLGFNFLEAVLPSELSKQVGILERGMAMGLYSTTQFLGIFLGGLLGAGIYGYFSITTLFIFTAMIATTWLVGLSLTE